VGQTGGGCTPEYYLVNVDFENEGSGRKIQFGFSDGASDRPIFTSDDDSLGGAVSMVNQAQQHLLQLPECALSGAAEYHDAIACSIPVRRLQVWSNEQGVLKLYGPNGGYHEITSLVGGGGVISYGADVAVGREYTLELADPTNSVIEFSDPMGVFDIEFEKNGK
jgi:hypothetical protein